MTDLVATSRGTPRFTWSATERRFGSVLFAGGFGLLMIVALWCGRGLWFYSDEWNIIAAHHAGNWTQGFNGQWLLIPAFVFWVLLHVFGLFEYLPFRLVGLACYAAAVIAFHAWARRRTRPIVAALAALAVAWYSTSWNVVMMPLLMNYTIPVAMLFVSWILLERRSVRGDAGVALCLLVGVLCSNVGLVVCVIVGVEFLASRERIRRWWVFVPAAVVWIPWYLIWYEPVGRMAAVSRARHWGISFVESYARGFVSGWDVGKWCWLAALAAVAVWAIVRRRWSARSVALAVGLAFYVTGSAFRAADFHIRLPPDADWYLWLFSVLVAAWIVEVVRERQLHLGPVGIVAVVIAVGAFQLYGALGDFHTEGIAAKADARTWFAAADALGTRASANASLAVNIVPVPVGDYTGLRRDMGSPASGATLADLGSESTREAVDWWMLQNLGVGLHPGLGPGRGCRPAPGASSATGSRLPEGAVVHITAGASPVYVRFRRFAREFRPYPFAMVAPRQQGYVSIPTDNSDLPWYVGAPGADDVLICQ